MMLTLTHFLIVSALLLAVGIFTLIVRRSAIGILMGIQLIISAAALNFIAFDAFLPAPPSAAAATPRLDGQVFAFFILLTAALQAALALAIFLNLHTRSATPGAPGPSPTEP